MQVLILIPMSFPFGRTVTFSVLQKSDGTHRTNRFHSPARLQPAVATVYMLCSVLFFSCPRSEGWRRGVVVSGVRRMNEVNARRVRLVPGCLPSSSGYTISVCNKPTRSSQPCIPPRSLSRVPASAGVRAGMLHLPGGR